MKMVKWIKNARTEMQRGRVGYLLLWLMGAPVGLLLILWMFLGSNIIGPG